MQAGPDWANDRAVKEQTLSRYYLPNNPNDPSECPTFTSQSMLQSLRGYDKTVSSEEVTIVRVSWTVFTPRFMHENKAPTVDRAENMTRDLSNQQKLNVKFRGPFDDVKYNDDDDTSVWSVNRNLPPTGKQAHFTKGVEVELLNGSSPVAGTGVFIDPDKLNQIGGFNAPTKIRTDKLHYRVRFRYPVDQEVDPNAGANTVDPAKHYLLDTPVFDDISIVYVRKPKFLSYREVTE